MFKIAAYTVMAGSILCALQTATGPPAFGLDRYLELTNNTRMNIVENLPLPRRRRALRHRSFWVPISWRPRVPPR